MMYDVYFRCLLCHAIFADGETEVKDLFGTREKNLEEAVKSFFGGINCRGLVFHHCFKRTGFPLAEGAPIPQLGVAVFAGLRKR